MFARRPGPREAAPGSDELTRWRRVRPRCPAGRRSSRCAAPAACCSTGACSGGWISPAIRTRNVPPRWLRPSACRGASNRRLGRQRARRRREAGDARRLVPSESRERRRVARRDPHVPAGGGDRGRSAAHLLCEQHRRAVWVDQRGGRVERVRDPEPARTRDARPGPRADRDLVVHAAAARVQPGDAPGARDAHPDRAVAGGRARRAGRAASWSRAACRCGRRCG